MVVAFVFVWIYHPFVNDIYCDISLQLYNVSSNDILSVFHFCGQFSLPCVKFLIRENNILPTIAAFTEW